MGGVERLSRSTPFSLQDEERAFQKFASSIKIRSCWRPSRFDSSAPAALRKVFVCCGRLRGLWPRNLPQHTNTKRAAQRRAVKEKGLPAVAKFAMTHVSPIVDQKYCLTVLSGSFVALKRAMKYI